jgi:hypothetical protein
MLSLHYETMLDQLIALIHEYHMRVKEAASLLRTHKGLENPMYWRQAGISQTGFLDPDNSIEYAFHGVGCRVNLPSGAVDWDFGHDGRLDGIDAWFLWEFVTDGTGNFPEFKDKLVLDTAFAEAVAQGVIHKPFRYLQDNLYYLRSGEALR